MCSMKEQFHSHTEGKRAPWSTKLGKDKFNLFLSFWDCQSWELKCDSKWISSIRYLALFSWPMVIPCVTSHSFPALNTMYCADNFSVCISSPHLSSEHQTWVLTISTEISKRHLNFHFPSTSSLRLPQLSSWQLHSSSYSGQKSQHPSQFLYFSHTPYLIHQILSALHSNCIQNLTTFYNPNPPPWSRPPSFLTWITQRAS